MVGYFPLVMGKAPLLWLDNLPAECITSWTTLSRLFTTNYQAIYNRPGNTHHLARVRMRRDETLREYTNRYFENRNTLAGVKDEDVIAYYKKGVTNIKLFEKIHELDAHTIADLMACVDKLVDTQDAVMHDFNREDHDDGGNRSRKRSSEAYVADSPRPSTFLEGDFNMVMDDQCKFHRDANHTMRECEQLKRALGYPQNPRRPRETTMTTKTATAVTTTVTVDLIDVITVTANPTVATTMGTDVIIAATTAATTDATTTIAMIVTKTTAMTGMTTDVKTNVLIATTTGAMIIVAKTATTEMTTTARSILHHHCQKGATPMACSKPPTEKSTSSLVVAKRLKATGSSDQTQGRSDTSTLKLHDLYVSRISQ
jgi:hypothetical protein